MKHTADELQEGETMILTLADKNILDDKGDLSEGEDELENVLAVRANLALSHTETAGAMVSTLHTYTGPLQTVCVQQKCNLKRCHYHPASFVSRL